MTGADGDEPALGLTFPGKFVFEGDDRPHHTAATMRQASEFFGNFDIELARWQRDLVDYMAKLASDTRQIVMVRPGNAMSLFAEPVIWPKISGESGDRLIIDDPLAPIEAFRKELMLVDEIKRTISDDELPAASPPVNRAQRRRERALARKARR